MMMAYDAGHTGSGRLDGETVAAVQAALRAYLANAADPGPLRRALVAMAAEARAKSVLPEQLLIVVKDIWSNLAEVRAMPDVREQINMQQRVVTMCITEYYSS
jgi:hypothetical protein